MTNPRTPILIGVGQVTEKDPPIDEASSPLDLIEQATVLALEDAGISRENLSDLTTLVVVKSFREPMRNTPEALANRINATKAAQWLAPDGGNGPQYLVNRYSEAIFSGEEDFVLLSGAEAMATGRKIVKSGNKPQWSVDSDKDADLLFADRQMWNDHELKHGIWQASHVYPLFENALRAHYGNSLPEHQIMMGELFSRLSEVAESSPHAWYPVKRSPEEIATATPSNRFVGWPYTKFMNAMNQINQSASLLLTSIEKAEEMGVDPNRWVFLHGASDVTDVWNVSYRENFYSSPSMKIMGENALNMAGLEINDIRHLDLYSCFPSAVQIARNELGISKDDQRHLTVTGGLPFHGGAGNNYVMNSIAAMADKLRSDRGSFGMVTANGGYISKHAAGIYSTKPLESDWNRDTSPIIELTTADIRSPEFTETPTGEAAIETYSIVFGRSGEPENGIVVGRMGDIHDQQARRFLALVDGDADTLMSMTQEEFVGRKGKVWRDDDTNRFTPDL